MDISNNDNEDEDSQTGGQCQTDLDTHANMSVCGWNVLVVTDAGKTVEVNADSPTRPSLTVKVLLWSDMTAHSLEQCIYY